MVKIHKYNKTLTASYNVSVTLQYVPRISSYFKTFHYTLFYICYSHKDA